MTKIIRRIITKIIMRDFLKWKSWGGRVWERCCGTELGDREENEGEMGERNLLCFGVVEQAG